MKTPLHLLILSLLISSIASSQTGMRSAVDDFLISGENTPSTFHQSDARIFPMRHSGFLAAWADDRDGDQGFYAQKFDGAANRVGRNFRAFSNSVIQFTNDGSYLALKDFETNYSPYLDDDFFFVDARFYDSSSHELKTATLATAEIPWCGTGYLGVDYQCVGTSGQYLFLFRNDGFISVAKYDRHGSFVSQLPDSDFWCKRAAVATVAATVHDEYMVGSFQISQDYYPLGYFGTFVDASDSILAADVPLGFPTDTTMGNYWFRRPPLLKAISLADTAYEVFAITADSAAMYFRKFDHRGNPLSEVQSLAIPHTQPGGTNIMNFSLSNSLSNSFDIFLTNIEWNNIGSTRFNALYPFSENGSSMGEARIDTVHSFQLGDRFMKTSDSTFLAGVNDSTDVYLAKLSWFSPIDSMKLNDDTTGSNEITPFITPVDDSHFFVSWNDGVQSKGEVLDLTGTKVQAELPFESESREFFHDGTSVSLWHRRAAGGPDTLGFTVSRSDWTPAAKEIVAVGGCCGATAGALKILTDSSFVVLYENDNANAWLKLFLSSGNLIAQAAAATNDFVDNLGISTNDENSFWVRFGVKVRLFSNALVPQMDAKALNAALHLESHRFLTVMHDYYSNRYYGTIATTDGDTIRQNFLLAGESDEISFGNLTAHDFLVLVKHGTTIYAKTFTNDGVPDHDSVVIHSASVGNKKQATFSVNNGKAFFAWSEIRPPGLGYSVVGSVLDESSLAGVEERLAIGAPLEFALYQNYPNPFNPTTDFRFQISNRGLVSLKVFDVLGRQVSALLDEVKQPGEYVARWDASGLPSGIYFYRLTAGRFTSVKKMLFLK